MLAQPLGRDKEEEAPLQQRSRIPIQQKSQLAPRPSTHGHSRPEPDRGQDGHTGPGQLLRPSASRPSFPILSKHSLVALKGIERRWLPLLVKRKTVLVSSGSDLCAFLQLAPTCGPRPSDTAQHLRMRCCAGFWGHSKHSQSSGQVRNRNAETLQPPVPGCCPSTPHPGEGRAAVGPVSR